VDSFFIIVLKNTNESYASEEGYLECALNRFSKYNLTRLQLKLIGLNKEYDKSLQSLYDFFLTNKDKVVKIIQILYNTPPKNHFSQVDITNFITEPGDILNKPGEISPDYWRFVIEEEMKRVFFSKVVADFAHTASNDMVNSKVGLIKVYCDNNMTDKITDQDYEDATTLLNKFKESLDNIAGKLGYETVKGEKAYIIRELEEVNCILKDKINDEKKKQKLSEYLSNLFEFISKYRKRQ